MRSLSQNYTFNTFNGCDSFSNSALKVNTESSSQIRMCKCYKDVGRTTLNGGFHSSAIIHCSPFNTWPDAEGPVTMRLAFYSLNTISSKFNLKSICESLLLGIGLECPASLWKAAVWRPRAQTRSTSKAIQVRLS